LFIKLFIVARQNLFHLTSEFNEVFSLENFSPYGWKNFQSWKKFGKILEIAWQFSEATEFSVKFVLCSPTLHSGVGLRPQSSSFGVLKDEVQSGKFITGFGFINYQVVTERKVYKEVIFNNDNMGETTYIVIDEREKRTLTGHYGSLDSFVATLATNPATITDFNRTYQGFAGEPFYSDGNRPRVPEELSLDTIRTVLGMNGRGDDEVMTHWKRSSFYEGPNYQPYGPNERTKEDIPELTQAIIDEWKQEDPEAEEFPTANDYRRFLCNDGIVVADLRTKELRYISHGAFEIPRSRPTDLDRQFGLGRVEYTLPAEWSIVVE